MSAKQWSALLAIATAFVVASFITTAQGQVLPRNRAPRTGPAPTATAPVAPQPVAPAVGATAPQTRLEGRQEARDARAGARAAGETGPQARETARETRQETRQNVRGADYGLTFNNAATNGLVVSNIAANTAFANAGLRAGDQLVSLNGQPITSQQQFYQYLSGPNLGTKPLQLVTLRNGQRVPLTIQPQSLAMYNSPFYQYGFALDNQNPNQVLVQQVYPNTPAYTAGLRQGDVITGLGGQPINGVNAFTQGLTQATGNIPLAVTRAGQTQNLQLQALGNQGSSVRTALRPNYDGAAGSNANPGAAINAGANAQGGATINPPAGANINAQGGTGAATPATPTTPPTSATPATPATPAAPGTAPGIPAAPATPATPATPGAGTSPAPSAP